MANDNTLGEPVAMKHVVEVTPEEPDAPGFGWSVSDSAREDIDEMEANARTAEQRAGSLILRTPRK